MRRIIYSLLISLFFVSSTSHAFFTKSVPYSMETPPGSNYKLQQVGIVADGKPSELLEQELTLSLSQNDVDVISDRRVYKATYGGSRIDNSVLPELREILGGAGIFVVNTLDSGSEKSLSSNEDKKGNVSFTAKTTYWLKMNVQLVDLKTGKRDEMFRFDERKTSSAYATAKYNLEYPSPQYLEQQLIEEFVAEIMDYYFTGFDSGQIKIYADKKFLNKKVYEALKIEDYERALEYAKRSVQLAETADKVKAKHLARTHYNLGVVHFLLGDFDIAIESLKHAVSINAEKSFRRGLNIIEKAKSNTEAVSYWVKNAVVVGGKPGTRVEPRKAVAEQSSPKTGSKSELSQDEILAKIKKYKKLLDQDLITQEVYDKKTAPLIEQLDF